MIDTDPSQDDGEVYTVRFDEDRSPSIAVAEALETVLPDEDRPLFYYVDPDALDALLGDGEERPSTVTVTFQVESVLVTVKGDGQVIVRS